MNHLQSRGDRNFENTTSSATKSSKHMRTLLTLLANKHIQQRNHLESRLSTFDGQFSSFVSDAWARLGWSCRIAELIRITYHTYAWAYIYIHIYAYLVWAQSWATSRTFQRAVFLLLPDLCYIPVNLSDFPTQLRHRGVRDVLLEPNPLAAWCSRYVGGCNSVSLVLPWRKKWPLATAQERDWKHQWLTCCLRWVK